MDEQSEGASCDHGPLAGRRLKQVSEATRQTKDGNGNYYLLCAECMPASIQEALYFISSNPPQPVKWARISIPIWEPRRGRLGREAVIQLPACESSCPLPLSTAVPPCPTSPSCVPRHVQKSYFTGLPRDPRSLSCGVLSGSSGLLFPS